MGSPERSTPLAPSGIGRFRRNGSAAGRRRRARVAVCVHPLQFTVHASHIHAQCRRPRRHHTETARCAPLTRFPRRRRRSKPTPSSSAPARAGCSRCSSSACSASRRTSSTRSQHPGGQCTELYPDKPIYDIPALPVCGAQELIDRLLQQIKPFEPRFHLGQEVAELARRDDGRFFVRTALGTTFRRPHRRHRGRPRLVPAAQARRRGRGRCSKAGSSTTACATPRGFTASGS